MKRPAAFAAVLATACLVGCTPAVYDHSPATRPAVATDVDPQRAEPAFWLDQSPSLAVRGVSYDRLWDEAQSISEGYLFQVDRRDRRAGLMTTVGNVSPQWFEPWRRELQSSDDVARSSVATIRRTIYWQFTRDGDSYQVVPKVLIEQESLTEQRISGLLGRGYFQRRPTEKVYGNRETDRNVLLPENYWYPIGRDFAFEQRLADKLQAHLNRVAAR